MLKFKTESFVPDDEATNLWVYNGLDCCLTYEIWEKLKTQFNTNTATLYKWEFSSQAVALEMMFRGFLVDRQKVHSKIEELEQDYNYYQAKLNILANAVWDKDLNPNSPAQLKEFFRSPHGDRPRW